MNMFTYNKKNKKFILILVLIILFNFINPAKSQAALSKPLTWFSEIIYFAEKGILKLTNNIFCNEDHQYKKGTDTIYFTPESIITGKFILLDANIFKDPETYSNMYDQGKSGGEKTNLETVSARGALRENVAGWYYSLLNFAIVALLSVLVYVGIRMVTSTISKDKSKYLIMLKDWFIALCLLLTMHFIMIATLKVTSLITDMIGGNNGSSLFAVNEYMNIIEEINKKGDVNIGEDDYTIADAYTYEILLAGIIMLTLMFAWKYLKRMFTIILLILLGPVSCVTYPIDKISDGKAQAFNKWLTEFIYNVLIQPFNLLLYLVLIGGAGDIASKNVLYAIAVFMTFIPAEKFIKSMFGFKDSLGSPLGAFAAGAAFKSLTSKKPVPEAKSSIPKESIRQKSDVETMAAGQNMPEGQGNVQTIRQENVAHLPQEQEQGQTTQQPENTQEDAGEQIEHEENFAEGGTNAVEQENPFEQDNITQQNEEENDFNMRDRIKSVHSLRTNKNLGDSGGRRALNAAGKVGKFALKSTAKTIGFGMGMVTGKGLVGAIAGATAANALVNNGIRISSQVGKNIKTAGSDYLHGVLPDGKKMQIAGKERTILKSRKEHDVSVAKREFLNDEKEQEKAKLRYLKKNNGKLPSASELKQEMEDRFDFYRYGLSDKEINNAVDQYQKDRKEINERINNDVNLTDEQRKEKSNKLLQQARDRNSYIAQLASQYENKFDDKKRMNDAYDSLTEKFKSNSVSEGKSKAMAKEFLEKAAAMNNEKVTIFRN